MLLISDFIFEAVRMVVIGGLMVAAVVLGKKLRDAKDSKKDA